MKKILNNRFIQHTANRLLELERKFSHMYLKCVTQDNKELALIKVLKAIRKTKRLYKKDIELYDFIDLLERTYLSQL